MGRRRSDQGTDALRLLAALFVVVIHVADPATTAGLCWDAAARFSVQPAGRTASRRRAPRMRSACRSAARP